MKRFSQRFTRHPLHWCQVDPVTVPPAQPRAVCRPAQRDHFVVQSGAVSEVDPADIALGVELKERVPVIESAVQEQLLVNRAHQDCAIGATCVAPPVDKAFGNPPANSGSQPFSSAQALFGCALFQSGIFFQEPVNQPINLAVQ